MRLFATYSSFKFVNKQIIDPCTREKFNTSLCSLNSCQCVSFMHGSYSFSFFCHNIAMQGEFDVNIFLMDTVLDLPIMYPALTLFCSKPVTQGVLKVDGVE